MGRSIDAWFGGPAARLSPNPPEAARGYHFPSPVPQDPLVTGTRAGALAP